MSVVRTHRGSVTASRYAAGAALMAGGSQSNSSNTCLSLLMRDGDALAAPLLNEVDSQQHRKRDHEHHERECGCALVVELFELGHDQERHDFGFHRHVTGYENHRTVFAKGAGEGQRESG